MIINNELFQQILPANAWAFTVIRRQFALAL